MNSVTFITGRTLHSIATPNNMAAWIIYHALQCAGIPARVWKHANKNQPQMMA